MEHRGKYGKNCNFGGNSKAPAAGANGPHTNDEFEAPQVEANQSGVAEGNVPVYERPQKGIGTRVTHGAPKG